MHRTRTASHAPARLALAIAAVVLASGVSGCHWFGKKDELYTQSVESRPLEVPPDLDRPSADRAMALPSAGGSATASGVASAAGSPGAAAPIGFNATGDRDALFAKVGQVLAATEGVTIANKAEILGTYDVSYMGANFLVRVTKVGDGAYISAVDPRGLPPVGEPPVKLINTLKAALAP
ncbi:MAG: hypothetical protein J0M21_01280 [Xanthomonadales bacterium]|nr:hypothetical protein [Xanthomonadales bacterium]